MKFNYGTSLGCLALILWAMSFPISRINSYSFPPYLAAALQSLFGGLFILLLYPKEFSKNKHQILTKNFIVLCTFYLVRTITLFYVVSTVYKKLFPLISLTNYLWPSATIIISILLDLNKVNKKLFIIGTLLIIFGMSVEYLTLDVLIQFQKTSFFQSTFSIILIFISMSSFALFSAFTKFWNFGSPTITSYYMIISGFICFVISLFMKEVIIFENFNSYVFVYMLIYPAVTNIFWISGCKQGNLVLLSLLADFLPFFSLLSSFYLLDINISINSWISVSIIIFGALISRLALKK